MFAPEGIRVTVLAGLTSLLLCSSGFLIGGWGWILVALGPVVIGALLLRYRDPERMPPPGADHLLLAPADGRVVEIADEVEASYLEGASKRVSILVAPWDVHVLRSPATGTVALVGETTGRVGLRHDWGVPVFLETSGTLHQPREERLGGGDRVSAGERFGLLSLRSRVNISVPPHVVLDVRIGQPTVAGETVIGRLPSSAGGDGADRVGELPYLQVA